MGAEKPFFSIIIPTRNRPDQLSTCLQSMSRLNYSRSNFQVIVVDDGSYISPEGVITPFSDGFDMRLVRQESTGPAGARNRGASLAKGTFLAFVDDDCAPVPDWLRILADHFITIPDQVICGRSINAFPENSYSTVSQMIVDYLMSHYNKEPGKALFFTSNNLAVPAHRFHEAGGFDTNFPIPAGEDRAFCDRLVLNGNRITYAPQVLVYHAHELTLQGFFRQHFNYGRGSYLYHRIRARGHYVRIIPESLLFYLGLLCYPFSRAKGFRTLFLGLLAVISQMAVATGFLRERWAKNKEKGTPRNEFS